MGICDALRGTPAFTRCEYWTDVRGKTLADLDKGVPFSDTRLTPIQYRTTQVGESNGLLTPQEVDLQSLQFTEADYLTAFQHGTVVASMQTMTQTGLATPWLSPTPHPSPAMRHLSSLSDVKAKACGLLEYHTRSIAKGGMGIRFLDKLAGPVEAASVKAGQKLDCLSYAMFYFGAALLLGLQPHWMESIADSEITHTYIAVDLDPQNPQSKVYVDLMTHYCGETPPFPETQNRELSRLEALEAYHIKRAAHVRQPTSAAIKMRLAELQQALHYAPQGYMAHFNAGWWYLKNIQNDNAAHHFKIALELFPTMPHADAVKSALAILTNKTE